MPTEPQYTFIYSRLPCRQGEHGCGAEAESFFTLPCRGRVAARRDAGWGARRRRESQRATRAFTPTRRASRVDLPPPGEGEAFAASHLQQALGVAAQDLGFVFVGERHGLHP